MSAQQQQQPEASGQVSTRQFLIVGLGASAGGLEALQKFFAHMPADSGIRPLGSAANHGGSPASPCPSPRRGEGTGEPRLLPRRHIGAGARLAQPHL